MFYILCMNKVYAAYDNAILSKLSFYQHCLQSSLYIAERLFEGWERKASCPSSPCDVQVRIFIWTQIEKKTTPKLAGDWTCVTWCVRWRSWSIGHLIRKLRLLWLYLLTETVTHHMWINFTCNEDGPKTNHPLMVQIFIIMLKLIPWHFVLGRYVMLQKIRSPWSTP